MCMTRRTGSANAAGSARRISTIAPGPPVDAPMATIAARLRAAGDVKDARGGIAVGCRRGRSRARRCVITRMRDTSLTVVTNRRSQVPLVSSPCGFSRTPRLGLIKLQTETAGDVDAEPIHTADIQLVSHRQT